MIGRSNRTAHMSITNARCLERPIIFTWYIVITFVLVDTLSCKILRALILNSAQLFLRLPRWNGPVVDV